MIFSIPIIDIIIGVIAFALVGVFVFTSVKKKKCKCSGDCSKCKGCSMHNDF